MWGRASRDKKVVQRFVAALNARDADAIGECLTDDFTYIDSWREGLTGRDRILDALRYLLQTDPHFGIEVDTMDYREPHVLMAGRVNSTSFGMARRAVWQVTVRDGLISQYQAWAEGGPPPMTRMIMAGEAQDMAAIAHPHPEGRDP